MSSSNKHATAFDEILSTFGSDEDRQAMQGLAERYPQIKEYGLRQDEFSRKLNAVDTDLKELNSWRDWRKSHWVEEQGKTDFELEADARTAVLAAEKAALESRLAGGDVASFEEVQQWINKSMAEKGVVTKETLDAKEKLFEGALAGSQAALGRVALDVPYLNILHEREFGEPFRPRDFMEAVNKHGATDLEEFYTKNFVVDKRQARMKADYEAKLAAANTEKDAAVAAAKEQGRLEREREVAMGSNGQQPVDLGGAEMGSFQKNYLKIPDNSDGKVPATAALGENTISNIAANEFIQSRTNRRT